MSCIYLKISLLSCVVLKKWLSDVALNFWLLLIPLNYPQSPAKHLKQQGQIKHFCKPFSCAQCDYKSTTSASLRQHESIHIKENIFSCTRCDYKSTTSASLKEHEEIHNPTTSFRGWTDNEAAIAALNASVTTRVARETFVETPEVMSHLYQLWHHIYTNDDVTPFPQMFPTQLWSLLPHWVQLC